jgi:hypothetical protein
MGVLLLPMRKNPPFNFDSPTQRTKEDTMSSFGKKLWLKNIYLINKINGITGNLILPNKKPIDTKDVYMNKTFRNTLK